MTIVVNNHYVIDLTVLVLVVQLTCLAAAFVVVVVGRQLSVLVEVVEILLVQPK